MKKTLFATLLFLSMALTAFAAVPKRVADAAARVNALPALEVTFKVNGSPCSMTLGEGGRFVLDMGDAKVYYDGKTQWAYSAADKEVTIFNPTAAELLEGNPAAILSGLGTSFSGVRVSGENYRLTPLQKDSGLAEVGVSFPASGVWPSAMNIVTANGTMSVTDLKFTPSKTKRPDSAFRFRVPKGTAVTDLR